MVAESKTDLGLVKAYVLHQVCKYECVVYRKKYEYLYRLSLDSGFNNTFATNISDICSGIRVLFITYQVIF